MVVPTYRALHMFQQNRYELRRYTKWLQQTIVREKKALLLGLVLILLGSISYLNFFVLAITTGFLFYQESHRRYIKPLVWTARVKRQLGVDIVLVLLVCVVLYYVPTFLSIHIFVGLVFPWLLIYAIALLTAPVEHYVRHWYLMDAKKKLMDLKQLKRIGITGSYGKTTTKHIVQAIVSEQYLSLMTPASYNTPMGITRTIREYLKPIYEVFVCEMGADHVGDIQELVDFVHPQIGIVTSIGPQHLQTFGSLENIIQEKMKLIEGLDQDGVGVINLDNPYIASYQIKNNIPVWTYGIDNPDAKVKAQDIQYHQQGTSFTLIIDKERYQVTTKLLGRLNILNILSAVCVGKILDIPMEKMLIAIRNMNQVEHRLEQKIINGYHMIDDAFNANPTGSKGALEVLAMMPGKRVIVTPGMIELADQQEQLNFEFGQAMLGKVDIVLLVGKQQTLPIYRGLEEVGFAMDQVFVFDKVSQAFDYIYSTLSTSDTILLENDLPDAFNH